MAPEAVTLEPGVVVRRCSHGQEVLYYVPPWLSLSRGRIVMRAGVYRGGFSCSPSQACTYHLPIDDDRRRTHHRGTLNVPAGRSTFRDWQLLRIDRSPDLQGELLRATGTYMIAGGDRSQEISSRLSIPRSFAAVWIDGCLCIRIRISFPIIPYQQ